MNIKFMQALNKRNNKPNKLDKHHIQDNESANIIYNSNIYNSNNFDGMHNQSDEVGKTKKKKEVDISYASEIRRKLIHLFSLSIPLIYIHIDKSLALILISIVTVIIVFLDVGSKKIPFVTNFMNTFFGDILRKHEKKKKKFRLNGASWLTISAFLTILIFPKIVAVVAFTILIISDISSALIGKKFGKIKIFKKKTLEGSIAFFVSASIIVFIYQQVYNAGSSFLLIGIFAALVSAFFEAISKKIKIDDNLLAPISFSIVFWLGEFIANYFGQSYIHIL